MIAISLPLLIGILLIVLGFFVTLGGFVIAGLSDHWNFFTKWIRNPIVFYIGLAVLVCGILFLTPVFDWTR